MKELWNYRLYNNTLQDWAIALGIIVFSIIIVRVFQSLVVGRIKKLSSRTKTTIDDFLVQTIQSSVIPLLYFVCFYIGLQYLALSQRIHNITHIALMAVITYFFLKIITSFISYSFRTALLKQDGNEQRERQSKGILLIIQIVIWLIGLVFMVDNLGYDVTTIVAGLGIGGIAIALAAQAILGDLFSYLVIFFDKPFEIGDFIIMDDKMGTVEYIGLKTTRIRTLSGEQLICSNTDLTNSRVHNYKRMQERRVVFGFGVVYSTTAEQLEQIPVVVKAIIDSEDATRFDRAHLKGFGNSSLDFEIVYYILSPDYNQYMDKQQTINLGIIKEFEKLKVDFAFPTRTVYLS